MSSVRKIVVLPRGELHPFGRCCWGGVSARDEPLRPFTLPVTMAAALKCSDNVGCIRRQIREKTG